MWDYIYRSFVRSCRGDEIKSHVSSPCLNANKAEAEKATPLDVPFGWNLKIKARITGEKACLDLTAPNDVSKKIRKLSGKITKS